MTKLSKRSTNIVSRVNYKRVDLLSKHDHIKYIVIPVLLVLVASIVLTFYYSSRSSSNQRVLKHIMSYQTSSGKLNDFQNNIGVKTADDIKYYVYDGKVRIEFGKQILEWDKKEFYTDDTKHNLELIGVECEIDKKTKALVMYWGGTKLVKYHMEGYEDESY